VNPLQSEQDKIYEKARNDIDIRKCSRCRKDTDEWEEHHLIPVFLWEMCKLPGSPDIYRIILCKKCHLEITKKLEDIRRKLK